MQINKKRLKHIRRKLKKSKRSVSKLDTILNNLPYKQSSVRKISERGKKIIRPAKDYLTHKQNQYENALSYEIAKNKNDTKKHSKISKKDARQYERILNHYKSADSRTLSFGSLKKNSQGSVTLCGFVGGYKLDFNHFYHQVAIYILLRYVSGFTYNHKFKYLTDHLWIDTNLANRLSIYNSTVGVGDCVIVRGQPSSYNGFIGNLRGVKISLDDAIITNSGYPAFKNNDFTYQTIPYNHGNQFIYYANAQMHPNIVLGNEISSFDRNHIYGDNYYIGYSNEYDLGTILHRGLKIKAYKHNPRLIVTFRNYKKHLIKNVRWTTNNYSIRQGMVLTSAKNYQHHPKTTERSIDNRLKQALNISYRYIIKSAMHKNE